MPASYGLRQRPQVGFLRHSPSLQKAGARRVQLSQSLRAIPLAFLAPLAIVAGLTAGFALSWTHAIHTDQLAETENHSLVTGTVIKAE